MSSSKLIPLAFHMGYNKLTECCTEKVAYLNRDVADLEARGITPEMIIALEKKRTDFVALPTNTVKRASSSLGFEKRNIQTEVLRTSVHLVYEIAKDTFREDSSEIKLFNLMGLS